MNWHYIEKEWKSKRRSSSPALGNNTIRYNDTLKDKRDKGIYCLINILDIIWHTIEFIDGALNKQHFEMLRNAQ